MFPPHHAQVVVVVVVMVGLVGFCEA